MNFIMPLDLEATCCNRGSVPRGESEIIEIGACMVDGKTLEIVDEFNTFIQPVLHPILFDFCRDLTSITQSDVNTAPGFVEAMLMFEEWMAQYADVIWGSWGNYDRRMIKDSCNGAGVVNPMSDAYINFKVRYAQSRGTSIKKAPGIQRALRIAGLEFEGTAHRGIDDTRNIVRLLPSMKHLDKVHYPKEQK